MSHFSSSTSLSDQVWLVQFTCETVNIFLFLLSTSYQDSFSFSNISMYYSLFHWITCDNRGFKYFKFAMIFPICWNNWCLFLDGYYIYYIHICIICKQLFLLYFIIFILFFWNLFLHFYPFFFFCLYISWIKQKY